MSTNQPRPGAGVVTTHTRAHVDIHDALADLTFADAVHAAMWIYDQEDHGVRFTDGADAVQQACHELGIRHEATQT